MQFVLHVRDELGNCWMDLGIALNLSPALLRNILAEYPSNKVKAYAVLWTWIEKEGPAATMGRLAVALGKIGKHDIVQKLIGTQMSLLSFLFLFFRKEMVRIDFSFKVNYLHSGGNI